MDEYNVIDLKLFELINACKKTGNLEKILTVSVKLISNIVNEIGISLGIRPRLKQSKETIFNYIILINEVFKNNLKITIFKSELVNFVKTIELQILRKNKNVPLRIIKEAISAYYELRKIKLKVPNLHENFNEEEVNFSMGIDSNFFFSGSGKKEKSTNILKPLILGEIEKKERMIRKSLSSTLDKNSLETAIYLKYLKESLQIKKNVTFKGPLKESLDYQTTLTRILGLIIIGISVLFFTLGSVVLIETILFPVLINALNSLILMFFGCSILLIIIYWIWYKGEM